MAGNELRVGWYRYKKNSRIKTRLSELSKKAQANPDNLDLHIRIGDLFVRLGQKAEAIEIYSRTAEKYARKKLFIQAIALNRVVLCLDPSRMEVNQKVGKLYEQWFAEEETKEEEKGQH